ncbi:MAG: hypothetical protein DWQ37_12180 [Planctomycetota bacterium]|nr:MAG: hypothetical protein DWQ37_12180 [Planctomycetota bacterium]
MKPNEFIVLAGRLAAGVDASAAERRSATSRAYYGAYHTAVNFLIAAGLQPPREHGEVQRMLARNDKALAASYLLSDL